MTSVKPDGASLSDNKESNLLVSSEEYAFPCRIASYICAFIGLFAVLKLGLLAAFFSGLLVYSLIHRFSLRLSDRLSDHRSKIIAVALIGMVVILLLTLAIWGSIAFFQGDAGNMHGLLQKMADILDRSREEVPAWLREHVPESTEALREAMTHWLREHAQEATLFGTEAGRAFAHILIGMIIGAMVTLHEAKKDDMPRPLAAALIMRLSCIQQSFEKIVFAQVRISAINTAITAVFVLVVLPCLGVHLPLAKTLIVLTFVVGLLPVVGNLLSNSVMVVLGLAHSLVVAMGCLIFLIVIHKLEYFLNARIIGSHIHARAWELLVGLLVMEAVFGISGVIAAPVFYAYMKRELMDAKLV